MEDFSIGGSYSWFISTSLLSKWLAKVVLLRLVLLVPFIDLSIVKCLAMVSSSSTYLELSYLRLQFTLFSASPVICCFPMIQQ